jgi:hypothetical protein
MMRDNTHGLEGAVLSVRCKATHAFCQVTECQLLRAYVS